VDKEKFNLIIISVILTIIFVAILPQTVIAQQGGLKVLVVGDTIRDLNMKATQDANGQVNPVGGFAINPESVIQVKQGQNIMVLTTPTVNEKIEKVKVTDTQGKIVDLVSLQNNQWSLSGLSVGAYVLDVIVNTSNGKNAYETVLTVLEPDHRPLTNTETTNIVNQLGIWIKVDVRIVFEDNPTPTPEPSICYFDPDNEACDPVDGKCPSGFGFNEDEQCIPKGKCPEGYGRLDDDETGKCFPKAEIKTCPDGYITHINDECPVRFGNNMTDGFANSTNPNPGLNMTEPINTTKVPNLLAPVGDNPTGPAPKENDTEPIEGDTGTNPFEDGPESVIPKACDENTPSEELCTDEGDMPPNEDIGAEEEQDEEEQDEQDTDDGLSEWVPPTDDEKDSEEDTGNVEPEEEEEEEESEDSEADTSNDDGEGEA
jgi:hypothetical protein